MRSRALVAGAERSEVGSGPIEAQLSVWPARYIRCVVIVLAVILPEANGADLESTPHLQSEEPAARTGESTAGLGWSVDGVLVELVTVLLKPPLTLSEPFGRQPFVCAHERREASVQRDRDLVCQQALMRPGHGLALTRPEHVEIDHSVGPQRDQSKVVSALPLNHRLVLPGGLMIARSQRCRDTARLELCPPLVQPSNERERRIDLRNQDHGVSPTRRNASLARLDQE